MDNDQFYPDWLYKKLIEDDLPWEQKPSHDFEEFLSKYTLHDSFWVGIFHHVAFDRSVTLAFQWDSVWLPDELKEATSHVDDWPYLFVKITEVEEISKANFVELGRINRAIGGAEILKLEGTKHLAIDDVYGGQVNIVFKGKYSIIALNPDGSVLRI
ncbi:hypothetical protein J8M21_25600 [Pseudoalteromonas luteoviolacea]|uniref:hypothetical protein n=1 Tax=Pseudoalteromonas luteoviolacea TaxID=43657 RepID=UPI001B3A33FA|nr:hypothetical protein [Pseudoalteromonas luteoviolacea]MBQ4880578.1 hypothetical protein [Pseudoalteromonas luteoviolacea]MBQ4909621.1 hypothetical protein [Pseudoalteromonas luteoviolacea]